MHRRDFFGLSLAAGLVALGFSNCGSMRSARFGIHPWIGYEPLYLAEEFGWLPESVELVKGQSAQDSMEGLMSGELNGAALTLDEAIRVHLKGPQLYVVAVTDVSVGADVLMVRPGIRSLDQLRGKRIAVELAGVSGVLLFNTLKRAGIDRDAVNLVNLPVDKHVAAWEDGRIDASACYEPTASVLQELGGRRLFDSSELPETIFDVLVMTREYVASAPGLVRALLQSHFSGLRHLVGNPHDSVYRVATRQGISPEAVQAALATVMLPDLPSNHRFMARNGRIEKVARELSGMLASEGLIAEPLETDRFCNTDFLPSGVV